jgi:hypothetical protein
MSEVFVLRNQHGEFLNKQREWLACGDSKTLFRSTQRDELINEKVELTVKSPELRIKIVEAVQEDNGRISIEQEDALTKCAAEPEDTDQLNLGIAAEDTHTDTAAVEDGAAEGETLSDQEPNSEQDAQTIAESNQHVFDTIDT